MGLPGKGRDILGERDAHPEHRWRPRKHAERGSGHMQSPPPELQGLWGPRLVPGAAGGTGTRRSRRLGQDHGHRGQTAGRSRCAVATGAEKPPREGGGNRGRGLGEWGPPWKAGCLSGREVPEPGRARCR